MKLFLLGFLSISAFCLNAQITVTSTDFASASDEVYISSSNQFSLDYATTGANHTWDFSSLVSNSQALRRFGPMSEVTGLPFFIYGTLASAPYKASYFLPSSLPIDQLGSLIQIPLSDVRQFTKKSTTALTLLGFSMAVSGTAIPAKSDTIETQYALPLTYGSSNTSRGYTKLDMNPYFTAEWRQHRNRVTTVDGWGSITTPYGTFQALRVKHVIAESDSFNYNGLWIPLSLPISTEYEWWTTGEKVPVLKATINSVGGSSQVTGVEFKNNQIVGLDEVSVIEATLFPNPTIGFFKVQFSEVPKQIQILDLQGKVVLEDKNPSLFKEYDIQSLDPGMYFLNVMGEKSSTKISIIKEQL